MITQRNNTLPEPIRAEGCLLLSYLWIGLQWRNRQLVQDGEAPHDFKDYEWSRLIEHLQIRGAVGDDAYVKNPEAVISIIGNCKKVRVEWGPSNRQCAGQFGQAEEYKFKERNWTHFVGTVFNGLEIYDPWPGSTTYSKGVFTSTRRVFIE